MRAGVSAVGGDIDLDEPVALETVVFGCGRAYDSVGGQHDDAIVAGADAYLVLSTDHAVGLDATQLALLDDELLVAVVELGAEGGHDDLLAGSHIGRAADNLLNLGGTDIHGADMHVITIGMGLAGEHFAHDQALQTTLDGLYFFHAIHLETTRSKSRCYFLSREVGIDVLTKPFVGDIHLFDDLTIYNLTMYGCTMYALRFAGAKVQKIFELSAVFWQEFHSWGSERHIIGWWGWSKWRVCIIHSG